MISLKIPYALDETGQLININVAEKGNKYYCPSCKHLVIVRKGEIKVHHYAHKADNSCTQETAIHKIAKLLIQKSIISWKSGQIQAPIINRTCQICQSIVGQPLSEKVEGADLEVRVGDGSIVDVALMNSNIPIAGIEIRVTHKVDERKAKSLPIPICLILGIMCASEPCDLVAFRASDKHYPFRV